MFGNNNRKQKNNRNGYLKRVFLCITLHNGSGRRKFKFPKIENYRASGEIGRRTSFRC